MTQSIGAVALNTLTYHHETGAFPLCNDCFDAQDEVELKRPESQRPEA